MRKYNVQYLRGTEMGKVYRIVLYCTVSYRIFSVFWQIMSPRDEVKKP